MTAITATVLGRYGVALIAVAAAFLARWGLAPWLEGEAPCLLFVTAVIGSAWFGGRGPGALATLVSVGLAILLVVSPDRDIAVFPVPNFLRLTLFLLVGVTVTGVAAYARGVWRDARNQRDWLSAVLATTGDAVVALDADGKVSYLNPAARRFTGWSQGESVGMPAADVLCMLDSRTRTPLPDFDRSGAARPCLLQTHDGALMHIDQRATPMRDRQGRLIGTLVVFRDRTEWSERLRTEANLRESEARFRLLADSAPVLIWMAGPDTGFDYFNKPWLDFTGRNAEQHRGLGWADDVHPDDRARALESYAAAFDARRDFEVEYRLRRHDGVYRDVLCRGRPRFTPEGTFLGFVGSCLDITERKLAEEELREKNRRKDQFLGMLSHELRNPLAPILNSLQILRLAEMPGQEATAARDVIDRQTRLLASMVNDLLDVFRLSHHEMPLNREPLDLAALVRRSAEERRPALETAGLTLAVETPPDPVWVSADRARLVQVVRNLLQNAAKFTPRGGRVTIRVGADVPRQQGRLSVADDGVGMTPDVLGALFEPFAQGRQTLARKQGGLGLGLALVKGLVELHGGQVSAASAGPGKGAELSFWLPLAPMSAAAAPAMPEKKSTPPPPKPQMRLLIVEDNEDTADTLQLLLRRFGYEVRVANTGKAGVRVAKGWHPDVILCDLGLPEMDGFEVAEDLRHDPETASACLIAISGYSQDEDRRRSREVGFDMHLTKPVDPLELRRLLTEREQGTANREKPTAGRQPTVSVPTPPP